MPPAGGETVSLTDEFGGTYDQEKPGGYITTVQGPSNPGQGYLASILSATVGQVDNVAAPRGEQGR